MLRFHHVGIWNPGRVKTVPVPSTRRIDPAIERLIDAAWTTALARPGVHLFDGPMCRLEGAEVRGDTLCLSLSKTSYKPFLGTNLSHPELHATHADCFANATGVSTAVVSSDGHLLLGRRNTKVVYYPNRLHPFAGALEPRDSLDPFDEVYRELNEELGMNRVDVRAVRCLGIAEDVTIHQPETIFAVESTLTRDQIRSQVDDAEHHGSWSVPAEKKEMEGALSCGEAFTPIAVAVMLLLGKVEFGDEWFARHYPDFMTTE